jgi:hypothetical protein
LLHSIIETALNNPGGTEMIAEVIKEHAPRRLVMSEERSIRGSLWKVYTDPTTGRWVSDEGGKFSYGETFEEDGEARRGYLGSTKSAVVIAEFMLTGWITHQ